MPGGSDLAALDVGPVTSFVATAPPGVYHVTVLATNACGVSTPSNPIVVSVGVLDPAGEPDRDASAASRSRCRGVAVAGATSYLLEAGFAPGLSDAATFPLTATGLAVTGVPSGTYYVRVRAVSSGGAMSAPSAEIVIVVP